MRAALLSVFLIAAAAVEAQTVTSVVSGPALLPTTWSCNCVSGAAHDVVISHAVTAIGPITYHSLRVTSGGDFLKTAAGSFNILATLDIDAGGVFRNNGTLDVAGNYICDGTHAGTGLVRLVGMNTNISGTGAITNNALFAIRDGNKTILAGTDLVKSSNNVRVSDVTVNNLGHFDLKELNGNGTWINGPASYLRVRVAIRNQIVLHASALNNTVAYLRTDSSAQVIVDPIDGAYHHIVLQANSTSKRRKPVADLVVNGDLALSGCTFDVRRALVDHDVTVRGNWTNTTGILTPRTGKITLGGTAVTHVIQPVAQPFYHLTIAGTDTVKIHQAITVDGNMIIDGILDVQETGNYGIDVNGDWTCNGMLVARYGKVAMSGGSSQAMAGVTFFHDLEIDNSSAAGVTIASGPQHVRSVLELTDGNLSANGLLYIASNPSFGDARVAPITGGSISGNVRVFRYIDAGATNWRFLTSPSSGMTLQDWQDDFITSGYPGLAFPNFPFTSIYGYNEAAPGTEDDGFVAASGSTETVAQGEGYWVWCGDSLGGTAPFLIDVTGPLYTGDRLLPVAYTNTGNPSGDGWTMVGNPYASAIDWDSPNWTKTGINNAIYIWDPDAENFAGYVGGVSINGGSQYVASSQAFWVQANGPAPVLRATENVKSAMAVGFKNNANLDVLRLRVVGNGMADETVLRTTAGATSSFDGDFDAYEKFSATVSAPSISSKMPGNKNLMVNTVAPFAVDTTFQVKVKVGAQANYSIQFSEVEGAFAASCMVLEDVVLGVSTPIIEGGSYTFNMSPNYNGTRFRVHASAPVQVEADNTSCSNTTDGSAIITGTGTGPWTYVWTDDNGNTLQNSTANGPDSLENLAPGTYTVSVDGACPQRIVEVMIAAPEPVFATAAVTGSTCNSLADGSIDLSVNGGVAPYSFTWSNGSNTEDQVALVPGNYSVGIADVNDCFATANFTVVPASNVEAAFTMPATSDAGMPVQFGDGSTGAITYAWNFGDGSSINSDPSPAHTFDLPGAYTVALTVSNGVCENAVSNTIEVLGLTMGVAVNSNHGVSIVQDGGQIFLVADMAADLVIHVRNLLGQEVTPSMRGTFAGGKHAIHVPETAAGILLVEVTDLSGTESQVFKVVR